MQQTLLALGLLERDPIEREHDVAHAQLRAAVVCIVRVRDLVEADGAVCDGERDAKASIRVALQRGFDALGVRQSPVLRVVVLH